MGATMRAAAVAMVLTGLASSPAVADGLSLPASITVDAQSPTGTSFALTNVSTDETLSFLVGGNPTLQQGGGYGVNAAGVVTLAGTTPVGGTSFDSTNGYNYGVLLVSFDGATRQLFATNAANGLGSATPPSLLTFSDTLADAFGLAPGQTIGATTINFRLDDSDFTDNAGAFDVRVNAAPGVPEPQSWALAGAGLALVGTAVRRRRRRDRTISAV